MNDDTATDTVGTIHELPLRELSLHELPATWVVSQGNFWIAPTLRSDKRNLHMLLSKMRIAVSPTLYLTSTFFSGIIILGLFHQKSINYYDMVLNSKYID